MAESSKKIKSKHLNRPVQKMNGNSYNPQQDFLELLRTKCPEIFTEGKVDPKKLKRTLGEEVSEEGERYGLSWAGKSDCFRHIQEPTTATLKTQRKESVDFDNTENIFIEGDNLEVLKILQKTYQNKIKMIYIDPPYNTGSDSFIYPDRFKEEKDDYELRAGIKDAEGLLTKDGFWRKNSKDAGHFHSNWLSMMYPRLFLAKNLLREDGVIFVSIDDNEAHNLRMVMNEILGEENFIGVFVWRKKEGGGQTDDYFVTEHEYILAYKKTDAFKWQDEILDDDVSNYKKEDARGKFKIIKLAKWGSGARKEDRPSMHFPLIAPDKKKVFPVAPDGNPGRWRIGKTRMDDLIKSDLIYWEKRNKEWIAYEKVYFVENAVKRNKARSILYEIASTGDGTKELIELFAVKDTFENPKPSNLIKTLLTNNTADDDIILDFFAGSCTTAHAVMQLNAEDGGNRKFICIQLAEPCEENSEAFKAGFKTIADIGKERIRRAAKKIKKEIEGNLKFDKNKLDLGFKVFKLEESNFKQWRENIKEPAEFKKHLMEMVDNVKKGAASEDMLFEIILKNSRFDLNVNVGKNNFDGVEYYLLTAENAENAEKAKIDSGNKKIHHEEKEGREGKKEKENEIICLDMKITKKYVDKVLAEKPQRFTCLDAAFKNNDQLKTNTALQMENAKIEFKVI